MEELLTAKQVQDTLKIDRTTIYRMIKDGRLTGIKVGNQWRFLASEIREILSGGQNADGGVVASLFLPARSMQPVQDVFAEMAEIGSVITDPDGIPLTQMSNCCDFCKFIQGSEEGKEACLESWGILARHPKVDPEFTTCRAGLQYARAHIRVGGKTIACLIAGQFYSREYDPGEVKNRVARLAREYHLDPRQLQAAAQRVQVLDKHQVTQISDWLSRVAKTFEQIATERVDMLSRLQHISEMSKIVWASSDHQVPA